MLHKEELEKYGILNMSLVAEGTLKPKLILSLKEEYYKVVIGELKDYEYEYGIGSPYDFSLAFVLESTDNFSDNYEKSLRESIIKYTSIIDRIRREEKIDKLFGK